MSIVSFIWSSVAIVIQTHFVEAKSLRCESFLQCPATFASHPYPVMASSSTIRDARVHVRTATSSDGCEIYADAVGDASKPALVFIHGYTLCAAVWDDIFSDRRYSEQFFLVGHSIPFHCLSGNLEYLTAGTLRHARTREKWQANGDGRLRV